MELKIRVCEKVFHLFLFNGVAKFKSAQFAFMTITIRNGKTKKRNQKHWKQ